MQLRLRHPPIRPSRSLATRIAVRVFGAAWAAMLVPLWILRGSEPPLEWLAIAATASVVAAWVAFRVVHGMLAPIRQLAEGARVIARGDTRVSLPERDGEDEVALLARTFNQMAARLNRNRIELEQSRLEVEAANASLRERNEELQHVNAVLEHLSITDGLTALHNHRFFQDQLTREIQRADRSGGPLALILIDIDDFKALNDGLGHAAGDLTLRGVAEALRESVRATDLLARYGGEEFAVLAPGTDLTGAVALAEKLRAAVSALSLAVDDGDPKRGVRVTVSAGVALYRGTRSAFFDEADRALYRAKASGKDCVVASGGD